MIFIYECMDGVGLRKGMYGLVNDDDDDDVARLWWRLGVGCSPIDVRGLALDMRKGSFIVGC